MIILHQHFPMCKNSQEMQDGHCHKDHLGNLGCVMGDTSSAFTLGKYQYKQKDGRLKEQLIIMNWLGYEELHFVQN